MARTYSFTYWNTIWNINAFSEIVTFPDEPDSGKHNHSLGIAISIQFFLLFLLLVCPGSVMLKDNSDWRACAVVAALHQRVAGLLLAHGRGKTVLTHEGMLWFCIFKHKQGVGGKIACLWDMPVLFLKDVYFYCASCRRPEAWHSPDQMCVGQY